MHAAAYQSRGEVAELLVRAGSDVNAKSTAGWTPLHKAMERLADPETSHLASPSQVAATLAIVELLLAKGADINAKDITGRTPLLWALLTSSYASLSGQALLSRERSLSPVEQWKVQDEIRNMKGQWREAAMLLINHGADVNANQDNIDTPLGIAANLGDKVLVEALDKNGNTPLSFATRAKNYKVANVLKRKHGN